MAAFTPSFASSMVCLAVFQHGNDNDVSGYTTSSPGSLTSRFEHLSTGGSDSGVLHASALQGGPAQSTGTVSWAQVSDNATALTFALRPREDSSSTASTSPFAQNPVHTYGAAGTYVVTLTVTDSLGKSSSTTGSVTVS